MYRNKVCSVPERTVSISQPWIRQIVRGKVKAPIELDTKLDVSLDEEEYGHLEKVYFEANNEGGCLIEVVKCYREWNDSSAAISVAMVCIVSMLE